MFHGSCPHCGTRLAIATLPAPLLTCSSCAGRCMVLMTERSADSSGEVQVIVLPGKRPDMRESWLERWGLRRVVLFGLIVACVVVTALAALGVLQIVSPGKSLASEALSAFVAVALLRVVGLTSIARRA